MKKDEKEKKVTKITDAYGPGHTHRDYLYERGAPDQFSAAGDDRLMNSLIMKYALEGKSNGGPNGQFFMTKDAMESVTDEVVGTHLGFTGAQKDKWV